MAEKKRRRCERCGTRECYGGKDCFDVRERSLACYEDPEVLRTTRAATAMESRHYMKLTRLEEVMRFAEEMGYSKIGVAFCVGLAEEAREICKVLSARFAVHAVCCKVGGVEKEALDLEKIIPERTEAMCNPAGQAILLEEAGTELNLIVGLCVGHDILFTQHSAAPVTTLVVKDRVLAHNPLGAIYSGYYRRKLGLVKPKRRRLGLVKPKK